MQRKKENEEFKQRMKKKQEKLVNYLPDKPQIYYKNLPFMPGLDFYRAIGDSNFNLNNLGT